jgi:hypothetical protein
MHFGFRTLLIVLAVGSPLIWVACQFAPGANLIRSAAGVAIFAIATIATWISFWPDRKFHREVASRETLDDAQFFTQFYADTNVPPEIPRRLRPMYCKIFDIEAGKLRPHDRPPLLQELDLADFVGDIEAEFGVTISDKDAEHIDGSFDSIARYLAERSREANVGEEPKASPAPHAGDRWPV